MLTLVLWQHVVFLCVSRTVFRVSLVMVVRRVLCSVRLVMVVRRVLCSVRLVMVVRRVLCSVRLAMDYVEVFVLCLQVRRWGWCH
jgi:hypothetical protein